MKSLLTMMSALVLLVAAGTRSSQALLITNHFNTDPGWAGSFNTSFGNNYGYSAGTANAGGSTGEVGGSFVRRNHEDYYADFGLGGLGTGYFTFGYALEGSGKFDLTSANVSTMNNVVGIGHRNDALSDRSFVGMAVMEPNILGNYFRVGAAVIRTDGTQYLSTLVNLPINGDYWFGYTYNPAGGVNGQGQLSLSVTNASTSNAFTIDLTAADRAIGAKFDSWGIGGLPAPNSSANSGDVWMDDVIYTAVPEPAGVALLSLGALLLWRRR
jgi:hypothetical protein